MTTPTNYVIRQQIKNISSSNSTRIRSSPTSAVGNPEAEEEELTVKLEQRKYRTIAAYGTKIKFYDNTTADILQPMPCMKWSPKKAPDSNGEVTLNTELECTVLTIGDTSVVLGYPGNQCGLNHELELLIDLGDTELIMNNDFYSVKAAHHVKDGVEQK